MSMQPAMILGIDGLGGAGKTTVAREIQQQVVGSVLLHIDDFIHPRHVRYDNEIEPWEAYYWKQWRYDYLVDSILQPMKSGLPIDKYIQIYNKEKDVYEETRFTISPGNLLIVEGVFLQREELREYFDQIIYVHAEKETRLQRVLTRDSYIGNRDAIVKKYEERYFPAEERYVADCHPKKHADLVITSPFLAKKYE